MNNETMQIDLATRTHQVCRCSCCCCKSA